MSDTQGFTAIEDHQVELLPARTLMSGGTGGIEGPGLGGQGVTGPDLLSRIGVLGDLSNTAGNGIGGVLGSANG